MQSSAQDSGTKKLLRVCAWPTRGQTQKATSRWAHQRLETSDSDTLNLFYNATSYLIDSSELKSHNEASVRDKEKLEAKGGYVKIVFFAVMLMLIYIKYVRKRSLNINIIFSNNSIKPYEALKTQQPERKVKSKANTRDLPQNIHYLNDNDA